MHLNFTIFEQRNFVALSQCSTSVHQAFDGLTEFLRVFSFVILSHSRNAEKFDACT